MNPRSGCQGESGIGDWSIWSYREGWWTCPLSSPSSQTGARCVSVLVFEVYCLGFLSALPKRASGGSIVEHLAFGVKLFASRGCLFSSPSVHWCGVLPGKERGRLRTPTGSRCKASHCCTANRFHLEDCTGFVFKRVSFEFKCFGLFLRILVYLVMSDSDEVYRVHLLLSRHSTHLITRPPYFGGLERSLVDRAARPALNIPMMRGTTRWTTDLS